MQPDDLPKRFSIAVIDVVAHQVMICSGTSPIGGGELASHRATRKLGTVPELLDTVSITGEVRTRERCNMKLALKDHELIEPLRVLGNFIHLVAKLMYTLNLLSSEVRKTRSHYERFNHLSQPIDRINLLRIHSGHPSARVRDNRDQLFALELL